MGLLVMMIVIRRKRGNQRFWDGMDLNGDERRVRVTRQRSSKSIALLLLVLGCQDWDWESLKRRHPLLHAKGSARQG